MRSLLPAVFISLLFIVSCGGGGGGGASTPVQAAPSQPVTSNPPPATSPVLTLSSTIDPKIYARDPAFSKNDEPPKDDIWHLASRYQGPNGGDVTTDGLTVRSLIDSSKFAYQDIIGAGPHNILSYEFLKPPRLKDRVLNVDFTASVDEYQGNSVAQLSVGYYMVDTSTGKSFAFQIFLYDNRFNGFAPYVGNDTATFFFSAPINSSFYTSQHTMMKQPFGRVNYHVEISPAQFQAQFKMLGDACKCPVSQNVTDWSVNLIGVLHEVFQLERTQTIKSLTTFSIPSLYY